MSLFGRSSKEAIVWFRVFGSTDIIPAMPCVGTSRDCPQIEAFYVLPMRGKSDDHDDACGPESFWAKKKKIRMPSGMIWNHNPWGNQIKENFISTKVKNS